MSLYPINLDIQDRRCLVIGGGEVASRKVKSLLSSGADVVVISPRVSKVLAQLAEEGRIELHVRPYHRGDLTGAFLVFAATDRIEVQNHIKQEAKELDILVNIVDEPHDSSFQIPARVQRGNFLLTVSTGGGSPALAAQVRKELEMEYGEEYKDFVKLLFLIREKVVGDGNTTESHRFLFQKLLQLNILSLIRNDDWQGVRDELSAALPENLDVDQLISSITVAKK